MKRVISSQFIIGAIFVLAVCADVSTGAASNAVGSWTRFEDTFTSTRDYGNPVQDVKVGVEFTSPDGNKRTLLAFWDEGRTWRVRFSPDEVGKWTYTALCSDKSNTGLHERAGSFVCEKYRGEIPLFQRGELRLSANRRY
ncbi:MAG: DUF5060 domain-containing protein, partial [Planctomycetota bacterium]